MKMHPERILPGSQNATGLRAGTCATASANIEALRKVGRSDRSQVHADMAVRGPMFAGNLLTVLVCMSRRAGYVLLVTFCSWLLAGCGSRVQVTVKVVDDDNQPVPDANVVVMGYTTQTEGKTDKAGIISARLRNVTGQLDFVVRKEGFYTIGWHSYYFTVQTNGQWQPWNPVVPLRLRRHGNPVPMVVKALKGIPIPAIGKPFGYDLLRGDWVSPDGKGEVSDFIFFCESSIKDPNNFSSRLLLTCSNPDDGLILCRIRYRDDYGLRLPAIAPKAGYINRWEFILSSKQNPSNGIRDVTSTATQDDNYYFRIRTRRDEKGNVISAIYGKIYYGISFDPGFWHENRPGISFSYYLNPDGTRNTEFDTRSNLCPNPGDAGGKP